MITELLQLYERIKQDINIDEPFVRRRIHWVIDIDDTGKVLRVSPAVSRNVDSKGKVKEMLGKEYWCPASFFLKLKKIHKSSDAHKQKSIPKKSQPPREVIAASGGGNIPPELLTGKPLQIFGEEPFIKKDKKGNIIKQQSKKVTKGIPKSNHDAFIQLHKNFLASPSVEFQGLKSFFDSKPGVPFGKFDTEDLARLTKDQRFTFRLNGQLLIHLPIAKEWWRNEMAKQRNCVLESLPRGIDCFLTKSHNADVPLAVRFPHIQGVPGGGGYCPIASFDKAPSQSFGLGEITATLGLDTAEKASAAFNWLLNDRVSHVRMGDAVCIFWAIDEIEPDSIPHSLNFGNLMTEADPLDVREFLKGAWGGYTQLPDHTRFYAAVLSSPQSRITIRSWHTETLPQAIGVFRKWLQTATLPDRYGNNCPTSIMKLADCTVLKSKNSKPLPRTYSDLFESALFGYRLPPRLFSAALDRQSLELAKGCDNKTRTEFEDRLRERTALIKIYFELQNKGEAITMIPTFRTS